MGLVTLATGRAGFSQVNTSSGGPGNHFAGSNKPAYFSLALSGCNLKLWNQRRKMTPFGSISCADLCPHTVDVDTGYSWTRICVSKPINAAGLSSFSLFSLSVDISPLVLWCNSWNLFKAVSADLTQVSQSSQTLSREGAADRLLGLSTPSIFCSSNGIRNDLKSSLPVPAGKAHRPAVGSQPKAKGDTAKIKILLSDNKFAFKFQNGHPSKVNKSLNVSSPQVFQG